MIRFFDAGESRSKELVEIIKRLNIREPFIRATKDSFYLELLQIFNVKIVNRVIKIGRAIDDSRDGMNDASICMKPVLSALKSIKTIDLFGNQALSIYKRSNVCIMAALGVVCKNVLGLKITKAFLEKFSGDSVEDKINSYNYYSSRIVRG